MLKYPCCLENKHRHRIPNCPCFIYKKLQATSSAKAFPASFSLTYFLNLVMFQTFCRCWILSHRSFHNFALHYFRKLIVVTIQGIQSELWSRYCIVLKGQLCHFALLHSPSLLADAYPEDTVNWQTQQYMQQQFGSLTCHLSFMAV